MTPQRMTDMPRHSPDPVFNQAWEAQAFAIKTALQEGGAFTAAEWAAALGRAIAEARAQGDPDTGETYYLHWLAALEGLVTEKGLAGRQALAHYRHAWEHAARRTPHGSPLELLAEDFDAHGVHADGSAGPGMR